MDILVRTQATADINLIVPLMINTGAPDTGATVTCQAINPDGTMNTAFTAPTISEAVAGSGVYKLIFPAAAANKLFTLANEYNPYTVLVASATAGSTGYRAIRVYCVDRLPGEYAKSSETASIQSTVNTLPTLATIEATTVLAKDATVAKAATVALDATVAKAAALPTLAQIEASTILAKEATGILIKKFIKNKKILTAAGSVYSLVVYDDNDIDEILRKTVKDISGADITAIGAGVIARETKSSV